MAKVNHPSGIRDRIKELRRVRAGDLLASPKNWRTHPEKQRAALRGALEEIGYADALIARKVRGGKLQLIDGHLRAELDPDQEVPVLVVDLSEAEAAKLLATLDPLSAMADADAGKLEALLREVETGSEELANMLTSLAERHGCVPSGNGQVVEDEVPEPPKVAVTKPGDLWLLGEHRLLCGDSTKAEDVATVMDGQKADLVVTSPPYNQDIGNFSKSGMHKETKWVDQTRAGSYPDNLPESEYEEQQSKAIEMWKAFLTDTASIFYNHKNRFRDKQCISPWRWIDKTTAKVRQEIIWMREGSVTQNMRGFMPCDERIFWMYFGKQFLWIESTEHKSWSTVWRINSHKDYGKSVHGCQFPVELPARAIRACSTDGMIVFEPYCGAGTTLIAADQLNRRCFGIEISPAYCDVIVERWQNLTGGNAKRKK